MSTIEVTDIGPVAHVSIPVPEGGGIVVLRGRNGRGKSKTLEAVESVVTGRGALAVRDGALRGEVSAFGAKVTVGRSTRRSGELEVVSLEGRMSIADLVDPKLKSPDAADAKRIKALIQLAGSEPKIEDFYKLVGSREEFERTVGPNALESDDYVLMSERIKRALEAAARRLEDQATNAEGRARGMLDDVREVDLAFTAVADEELQRQFEEDVKLHSSLVTQQKRYRLEQARIEEASQRLAGIQIITEKYIQLCEDDVKDREFMVKGAESAVADLERSLREAKANLLDHQNALRESRNTLDHAQTQFRQQEALRQAVSPTVHPVDESTIAEAHAAVEQSRAAIERAAVARRALERKLEAEKHLKDAGTLRRQADSLRAAAKDTDLVLSELVGRFCHRLRVEHGRLVLDTARGTTYYGDLSHGERWKLAIDIGADAVGPNGVIVVPQEAWEGLDPYAQVDVAKHVKGSGVLVLTAECGLEESITAEVFDSE